MQIADGYRLQWMSQEEFSRTHALRRAAFGDILRLGWRDMMSQGEIDAQAALNARAGEPFELYLGLYKGDAFVGWSAGYQRSRESFYMMNSGVLPEHRRKGLYTAMLTSVVQRTQDEGFQIIRSSHQATNNAVIIPKLMFGFIITGMEISDQYGTLVQLDYFTNERRRRVMDFRCGQSQPEPEVAKLLGFES